MSDVTASEKSLLREWIHWIMGSLVVWGLLLGVGTYLYDSGLFPARAQPQPGTVPSVVLSPKDPPGSPPKEVARPPVVVKRRTGAEEKEAILRGIIVATCVVAFVTFWWVMLYLRERRVGRMREARLKN